MPIKEFDRWIDETIQKYEWQSLPCSEFEQVFAGYYSPEYLAQCRYVVTEKIPKPDIEGLRGLGLGDFLDMDCGAITYKNMYFIKPQHQSDLEIHIHELMHTIQWQLLGGVGFLERYVREINEFGYDRAPLENMAYDLGRHFNKDRLPIPVLEHVRLKIAAIAQVGG
ncbi:hypothetical protein [Vibrio hangzhouensis]|uniref:DUF4157 domain-containing protein n=1 Tax=Vibrio hangzhouensis TaxID=462991 RepID=A0A1H5VH41_9VIBR|nr:hypothetical protein [Vibrio hangzhouensis]SEF86376.1 hypothetical protein SAMN04488244_104200 [Vibrio hangzhouensis]